MGRGRGDIMRQKRKNQTHTEDEKTPQYSPNTHTLNTLPAQIVILGVSVARGELERLGWGRADSELTVG